MANKKTKDINTTEDKSIDIGGTEQSKKILDLLEKNFNPEGDQKIQFAADLMFTAVAVALTCGYPKESIDTVIGKSHNALKDSAANLLKSLEKDG